MSGDALTAEEMLRCVCGHRQMEHYRLGMPTPHYCRGTAKWAADCDCREFTPEPDPVDDVLAKIDQGAPIRDEMHLAVDEAAHRRTPIAQRLAVCSCGHDAYQHVYHEGPCRPGLVCAAGCEKFTPHIPTASDANHSWEWRSARLGPPPRSTEGVTPAEMMEWPEMQALADLMHTSMLWDGVPRSSITIDSIEPDRPCMCGHDADDHRASGRGSCNACDAIGDACSDFRAEPDPIFDRETRPAPTRGEIAAMAVHDALDAMRSIEGRNWPGVDDEAAQQPFRRALNIVFVALRAAARNLPSVTERIAP